MVFLRAVFVAALLLVPLGPAGARDQKLTVVELFTSEGCSSCPPADRFVGELAGRDDILALSLHVDYWDYIGWKDRFADPKYTQRQRKYAKQFSLRYVYTPQIVVDGAYESVGSDRDKVLTAVSRARARPKVDMTLRSDGDGMVVDLAAADADPANVYVLFYDRVRTTDVTRGENIGQRLMHSNVVRDMRRIATWNGEAGKLSVPASDAGGEVCAVIVQSARTGRIIGAARLALDGKS